MLLSLHNIELKIGGTQLLHNINMTVESGTIVAIMGTNGAGKSSLIKVISGELKHTGQYYLWGQEARYWPAKERALRIATLPQHSSLNFSFTCLEVVLLGRIPHSTSAKDNRIRAEAAMEAMDIGHLSQRLYPLLSSGERQRVQLARVLTQIDFDRPSEQPKLLLLDEPAAALDMLHQHQLLQLLTQISSRNIAILMAIHDINQALHYTDKVLLLDQGTPYAYAASAEVLTPSAIADVFKVTPQVLTHKETGRDFFFLGN